MKVKNSQFPSFWNNHHHLRVIWILMLLNPDLFSSFDVDSSGDVIPTALRDGNCLFNSSCFSFSNLLIWNLEWLLLVFVPFFFNSLFNSSSTFSFRADKLLAVASNRGYCEVVILHVLTTPNFLFESCLLNDVNIFYSIASLCSSLHVQVNSNACYPIS